MILFPSKIPLDSMTNSVDEISPLTCPAAFISTLVASTLPSI